MTDISNEAQPGVQELLDAVDEICWRYGNTALQDFLSSCQAFAGDTTLNIAVVERFKAGKINFPNYVIGVRCCRWDQ